MSIIISDVFRKCTAYSALRALVSLQKPFAILFDTCGVGTAHDLLLIKCLRKLLQASLQSFHSRLMILSSSYAVFKERSTGKDSIFTRMEVRGFEPLTPCLQGRCSPS